YCPGSSDWISPVRMPSHIGPPWCGQRLNRPKNSPPRLNTAIDRPRTVTSLRWPGGISETVATTCLLMIEACPANPCFRWVEASQANPVGQRAVLDPPPMAAYRYGNHGGAATDEPPDPLRRRRACHLSDLRRRRAGGNHPPWRHPPTHRPGRADRHAADARHPVRDRSSKRERRCERQQD